MLEHYSKLGNEWVQLQGSSKTANIFYATAYGDLETSVFFAVQISMEIAICSLPSFGFYDAVATVGF